MSAFIPETYVESPGERISLYKKMISVQSEEEMEKLENEILDRFGPLPEPLQTLFHLMELKLEAKNLGVFSIAETEAGILVGWPEKNGRVPLDIVRFAGDYPNLIEILPPDPSRKSPPVLNILFKDDQEGDPFGRVRKFLQISSLYANIS